jgi:hypothetical protein
VRLTSLRRAHYPAERNRLDAHLTLFHHLPPSIGGELKARLAEQGRGAPPPARVAGIIDLGRGTALRVDSAALEDMRAQLADVFGSLLSPQDRADWRPHVTIQNKVDQAEAKALQRALFRDFRPYPLVIAGLASWHYRDGLWEPLSRHPFRG